MTEASDTTRASPGDDAHPDLPDLELIRMIGSGAYGKVWLGRNKVTGQLLAVKVVPLKPLTGADLAGREITSLIHYEVNRRTQHENLLPIYHVGQTEEVLFYTMELADDVSGRPASLDPAYRPSTLAARLENGPMLLEESLRCAEELLKGLACLHAAGMAHRDVKPANCLFVDGKLKLADFGLLTKTDGAESLVGTPRYMPPDKRMDERADVYAAGLVIYEMLTGLPASAFPRWSAPALEQKRNPMLAVINRVILRACQPEREKRLQDAKSMLEALANAKRAVMPSRGRIVARVAAASGAALMVAAAVTIWWWSSMNGKTGSGSVTDVSFITGPFEAEIYLDGAQAVDANGVPYRTPCTINALGTGPHRVIFKKTGLSDLDVGMIDFSQQREVEGRWK